MVLFFYIARLILLQEPIVIPNPNQYFWYVIAGVFGGMLLWMLKRDMDKKDVLLNRLVDSVNFLTTRSAIHDTKIEQLETDVIDLQDNMK